MGKVIQNRMVNVMGMEDKIKYILIGIVIGIIIGIVIFYLLMNFLLKNASCTLRFCPIER